MYTHSYHNYKDGYMEDYTEDLQEVKPLIKPNIMSFDYNQIYTINTCYISGMPLILLTHANTSPHVGA